ncbi:MAG: hypothetical protein KDA51_08525, partial [Planctomycetales bacterium]|nr:hypothetical protein [Planctomycetales bacterium]
CDSILESCTIARTSSASTRPSRAVRTKLGSYRRQTVGAKLVSYRRQTVGVCGLATAATLQNKAFVTQR